MARPLTLAAGLFLVLLAACGGAAQDETPETSTDAGASAIDASENADVGLTPSADAATASDAGTPDAAGATDAAIQHFTDPPQIAADVKQGDKGLAVGQLQFELKLATGKYLDEDGQFGPGTLSLLNTFQTSASLPKTSVADAATRQALATRARAGAAALIHVYPAAALPFAVPSLSEVKANVDAVQVIVGMGDKTATYMGRVGFAWGDGGEADSIRQGSPAHLDWVAEKDTSPSERRVIGVISHNEGPFDAVNSYDAGNYTWGAYQLIGSYRASPYNPSEDELSQGLAYMKILDPESFHHGFQIFGLDVTATVRNDGTIDRSSVAVSLLLTDGTLLKGKSVWDKVGTTTTYNQIFINAGGDPRIHRTEILSAKLVHFDVMNLALATGKALASHYFTSQRAVCAFLDMELNVGRGGARSVYSASVDAVAQARGLDATKPDGWPEVDRTAIEADILQEALKRSPTTRYATRMQKVLASVFIDDAARSFVPLK